MCGDEFFIHIFLVKGFRFQLNIFDIGHMDYPIPGNPTTIHILHNIRPQMRNARRLSDGRREVELYKCTTADTKILGWLYRDM